MWVRRVGLHVNTVDLCIPTLYWVACANCFETGNNVFAQGGVVW